MARRFTFLAPSLGSVFPSSDREFLAFHAPGETGSSQAAFQQDPSVTIYGWNTSLGNETAAPLGDGGASWGPPGVRWGGGRPLVPRRAGFDPHPRWGPLGLSLSRQARLGGGARERAAGAARQTGAGRAGCATAAAIAGGRSLACRRARRQPRPRRGAAAGWVLTPSFDRPLGDWGCAGGWGGGRRAGGRGWGGRPSLFPLAAP